MKEIVDEIISVLKGRQENLEEFNDGIFYALVEKAEIVSQTHFIFELNSGIKVEG